jgi:hypothetical protein
MVAVQGLDYHCPPLHIYSLINSLLILSSLVSGRPVTLAERSKA